MAHKSRAKIQEHALLRLRQRYGIDATQEDLDAVCARCARGEIKPAVIPGAQFGPERARAWCIVTDLHGARVGLIYSRTRHMIITASVPAGDGGFKTGWIGPNYYAPEEVSP